MTVTRSKGQPTFRLGVVPYQVAGSLRTAASRHLAGLDAPADMDAPGRTIPTGSDALVSASTSPQCAPRRVSPARRALTPAGG